MEHGKYQVFLVSMPLRAILYAQEDPYKYTSTWYYASVYRKTYGQCIQPIPDPDNWPELDLPAILPPVLKRGVGRPPRNRKREIGETEKGKRSTTIKCTNYGEWGHNRLTCKGGLTAKEKAAKNKTGATKGKGGKTTQLTTTQ